MTNAQLDAIVERMIAPDATTFAAGDIIVDPDDGSTDDRPLAAYMILQGEAEIFMRDACGKKIHIAFIGRNQIIGESALLNDTAAPIYAAATMTTTCRVIDKNQFKQLLQSESPFTVSLLKLMTARYRSLLEDDEQES